GLAGRIAGPHVQLPEAHLIEHLGREPGPMIGEPLGIAEAAVHGGDDAGLAAHVPGRAAVPERGPRRHPHAIAGLEAWRPAEAAGGVPHGPLASPPRRPAV